jgi:hypothetical protein
MGGKPRSKPVEVSAYRCWGCGHEWHGSSTIRGEWKFSRCVHECPKCGSDKFEEHFPDGATLKPYVRNDD